MLNFSWNTAYETSPGSGLSRGSIDDTIRQMARGVRQRMEREHQWGYNTEEDTGRHISGKTTVALRGDSATRAALTNVQDGAIYVETDGTNYYIYVYEPGTGWVSYTDNDHGNLENLTSGTSHDEVYWKKTDNLTAESDILDMGGNILTVSGAVTNVLKVSDHIYQKHPISSASVVKDGELTKDHLYAYSYSWSGSAPSNLFGNVVLIFELPSDIVGILGLSAFSTPEITYIGCKVNNGGQTRNLALIARTPGGEFTYSFKLKIARSV